MEEYEAVNIAAYDAAATAPHPTLQHQFEVETESNQSESLGVLKANSGNAAKRLKNRQETRNNMGPLKCRDV